MSGGSMLDIVEDDIVPQPPQFCLLQVLQQTQLVFSFWHCLQCCPHLQLVFSFWHCLQRCPHLQFLLEDLQT